MIEKGELKQGDKLPSERFLAEKCQVGRPAIREALSALEIMKVIQIRPGEGTFVRETTMGAFDESLSILEDNISPFEVLQARKVVESGIARTAATQAKPEDLVALKELMQEMTRKLTLNQFSMELDRKFHMRVAQATHNSILREVTESLCSAMRQKLWHALLEKNLKIPGRAKRSVEEHRKTYEAIKERNGEEAYWAMYNHLEAAAKDLSE